jgi:hypothetical protein
VITKIVSGGQTGVDWAALDVAIARGISHGGWCPRGRRAEDRRIPDVYDLQETDERDYSVRTRHNVEDSDGTLILSGGTLTDGTALTRKLAKQEGSPVHVVDLRQKPDFAAVEHWVLDNRIRVLNIAGPRESQQPGICEQTREWLSGLFDHLEK